MLSAAITCAKTSALTGAPCRQLHFNLDDPADLPAMVAKVLAEEGWSAHASEHYCARHDPADVGETFEVGTRYTPIRDTGWEVRVPPSPYADMGVKWLLEIRRTPDAAGAA